jgi:glycosyltransferase involved in cell wall biosynthesis
MQIAIVSEGFKPYIGGVETRYTKLAEYLATKHEVDVITLFQGAVDPEGGDVLETESFGRVRVFRVKTNGNYFLEDGTRSLKGIEEFSKKCTEYLKRNSYDIVLVSEWPLLHALYIRRTTNHNMIIDWHEVWGRYYWKFGLKGFAGYVLEKILARSKGIKHIAVSDFTKRRLQSILGMKENVPVIWNGIDPAEYHNPPNVIREDGKILFFGRFAPHKGIELLIKAFKIVKNIRPEASLHIVGDGPLKRQVIAMASRLEDIHVHIAVPRSKLLEIIKSAWVTVIPSHREGQGISYLESMAAGTPVITIKSPYNAFSNIVKNGEEALVANPEPNSLAQAILMLLKDENLHMRLSENGKIFASRFTWESISLELERVFENVLDRNY